MFEITPPQRALRERGASDGEADTRCLPGEAVLLRDRFDGSDNAACNEALSALVLARENENGVASAICLPPYIVFCVVNANVFARGSLTSALIANAMLTVRTEHRLEAYAIWTFTEDHIGQFCPKGAGELSPGFQPWEPPARAMRPEEAAD